MIDSERLIVVIENYQSIWNAASSDYHNKSLKDASWNSVCQELIEDWTTLSQDEKLMKLHDIKKRWNNIRDYYKKEIYPQKNLGTGQPGKKRKKYVFAGILEFLRPVFEYKINNVNNENTEEEPENDAYILPATVSYNVSSTTASTTLSTVSPSRSATQKKKKTPNRLNAFESAIIKALEKKPTTADSTEPNLAIEEDPDLMFLKSLLPDIKNLTSNQKYDFKIGTMRLLRSIMTPESESTPENYYRPRNQQNTLFDIPMHPTRILNCSPAGTNHASSLIRAGTSPAQTNDRNEDDSDEEKYSIVIEEQYHNSD